MKLKIILSTMLLTAMPGLSKDIITFSNGDILTGQILERNQREVRLKSDFLGEVILSMEDIKAITSDNRAADDTETASAKSTIQKQPKQSANKPEIKVIPPKPVEEYNETNKQNNAWKWSGKAGIGYSLRSSETVRRTGPNTYRQYSKENESMRIYGNIAIHKDKHHLQWNWNYRYSKSDVRKNDDYLSLSQIYRCNLTDKTFFRAKTTYEQDYLRDIKKEVTQTAEAGMKVIDKPKFKLGISAGGAVHHYCRDIADYSTTEGELVFDQHMQWQLNHMLTLYQNYSHLGNLEEYHLVFKGGMENRLIDDLFLRLEYRFDRDTEVMLDDKTYIDKVVITSLVYKF